MKQEEEEEQKGGVPAQHSRDQRNESLHLLDLKPGGAVLYRNSRNKCDGMHFVYTVGKDDCVQTQLRLTVLSAEKRRQWGNQTNLEVCQNQSPVKIARTQNTTVPSSLSPFSSENCRRQIETSLSLSWSLSLCFTHTWLHCVQAKGFL